MTLTARQERVLRAVIEEYIVSGAPVGSKYLSERCRLGAAPSTIRNELAELEERGILAHPHTSAGRVPTDAGYRRYVDTILKERREVAPVAEIDHVGVRLEIGDALRETAEAVSRVTEMLAVVSSPAFTTSAIHHIEILLLQPRLVMVVIITTVGQVTKRVFHYTDPVDEGLAEFARVYLSERLVGGQLGTHPVVAAFEDSELSTQERAFLNTLRPAFEALGHGEAEGLHVGGTSRLIAMLRRQGVGHLNELLEMLEERYHLLGLLSEALREDGVYLRIGHEIPAPSLQACSLVAANYGVANRKLGTVSVLGPTRMDYAHVIATVRATADDLSSYLEDVW